VVIGIGTAFFAAGFSNIANYFQVLFSWLNVPLFCAFIIGMLWKRAAARSGFWAILIGTLSAVIMYVLYKAGLLPIFRSEIHETLWSAFIAFAAGAIALVATTIGQPRKSDEELHGLVYGMAIQDTQDTRRHPWYNSPVPLGAILLVLCVVAYLVVVAL
jgi:SSS family solute:Na+ symporter